MINYVFDLEKVLEEQHPNAKANWPPAHSEDMYTHPVTCHCLFFNPDITTGKDLCLFKSIVSGAK